MKNKMKTITERFRDQQPVCGFGEIGACCRICIMGPCRVNPSDYGKVGICGARAYTVVARGIIRAIAAGCAAHSGHGKELALALRDTAQCTAQGKSSCYKISDQKKLADLAGKLNLKEDAAGLAVNLAEAALGDFSKNDGKPSLWLAKFLTPERIHLFTRIGVLPENIDGTISEVLHRTNMGTDAEPVNLLFGGIKCALADLAGEHISTDITDVLFGTPRPCISEANLGVLKEDCVNIAVHGHTPLLSETVVRVARDMEADAQSAGARGINVVGICCTGNELMMRKGVPLATNFASQELAIMTNVLDSIVVDVQCIMPGFACLSQCYHTRFITTMPISKIPQATHIEFSGSRAMDSARTIVQEGINAYRERAGTPKIPRIKNKVIAGFSIEVIRELMGDNLEILRDYIRAGKIRGVACFAGCNNPKTCQDTGHVEIAKKLAQNNILMVATGCAAGAFAKNGMLCEDALEYAGSGLKDFFRELCKKTKQDLPLILHMGSCVDNSRVADLIMALSASLNLPGARLPVVFTAPEPMSEKAIAIASWFLALGVPSHIGVMPPVKGSSLVYDVMTNTAKDIFGGYFIFETDHNRAAAKILDTIEERRQYL
ncbi:MAG: anaerobic carbon-monoxide dehydrogenase catalytic subunit [archaeon]